MAHPFHDFQLFHLENKLHLGKAIESYSTLLIVNVIFTVLEFEIWKNTVPLAMRGM